MNEKKIMELIRNMPKEKVLKMLDELDSGLGTRSTKIIFKNFKDADEVKLIPLGDVHIGDPSCDRKLLEGTLKYIEKSDSQVIGMGDYINASLKNSVSDIYSETMSPMLQFETILDYFEPIKKNIWGLHMGNHEYRIWKDSGINIVKEMAKRLDTKYLGFSTFTKIKVGNQNYVIYSTHGASGAYTPEGKLRAVRKLGESFDADIYLYGHVHELLSLSEERRKVDMRGKRVIRRKKYYVLTGHFLNYEDSYAEMKNYRPGKKGVAKIKFFGDRWDFHVTT